MNGSGNNRANAPATGCFLTSGQLKFFTMITTEVTMMIVVKMLTMVTLVLFLYLKFLSVQ